jgi:alginate O-acetyltransferase complex protein AlgI
MVFSSPRYLVFFVLVLLFLSIPLGLRSKKRALAVFSATFYAAWDYRYLGLLLLISVIDYVAADRIVIAKRRASSAAASRWLWMSIASNLAILGYFKYYNFFLGNLNGILSQVGVTEVAYQDILLPAGISFYTFKSMSYTIDVYREAIEPCESWLDYCTFITFFPELIAGPIVRASVFLRQMGRLPGPSVERLRVGAAMFVMGLTKKRVIADNLSGMADPVFAAPELYDTSTLWLAAFAYSVQIYCDFSGYSDMALGSAKMIGYDLPENFRVPYLSVNITEFWRRWHMTLSQWLRDYLYIPLGGNRKGSARTYVNLTITMLLGGLWHGASWNFVVWGALHGVALALHRRFGLAVAALRIPRVACGVATFAFVSLCWIPFRAPSSEAAVTFVTRMFSWSPGSSFLSPNAFAILVIVAFAHVVAHYVERQTATQADSAVLRFVGRIGIGVRSDEISGWSPVFKGGTTLSYTFLTVLALCIIFFSALATSPFIYFQF